MSQKADMDTAKGQFKSVEEKISYNIPTFTLDGRLVYFATWKSHIALYSTSSAMEASIQELSTYKTGKGTIQFPIDQPLPLPLIRKIVEFRVEEIRESSEKNR